MANVTYISFDGTVQRVELESGISVMEGAILNSVAGIESICGGNCYCGMCRVYVDDAWRARVGEASEYEAPVLEGFEDGRPGARLSCQIKVSDELDGLVIHTPEQQG